MRAKGGSDGCQRESAAATPIIAERQLRVAPTARTIVSASTASTAQAMKTDKTSPTSVPLMIR